MYFANYFFFKQQNFLCPQILSAIVYIDLSLNCVFLKKRKGSFSDCFFHDPKSLSSLFRKLRPLIILCWIFRTVKRHWKLDTYFMTNPIKFWVNI